MLEAVLQMLKTDGTSRLLRWRRSSEIWSNQRRLLRSRKSIPKCTAHPSGLIREERTQAGAPPLKDNAAALQKLVELTRQVVDKSKEEIGRSTFGKTICVRA